MGYSCARDEKRSLHRRLSRLNTVETYFIIIICMRYIEGSTKDVFIYNEICRYIHAYNCTRTTSHSTLRTPHSALRTPHSTLRTSHSTLHTPHSALRTSHFALLTPHSTLRTSVRVCARVVPRCYVIVRVIPISR